MERTKEKTCKWWLSAYTIRKTHQAQSTISINVLKNTYNKTNEFQVTPLLCWLEVTFQVVFISQIWLSPVVFFHYWPPSKALQMALCVHWLWWDSIYLEPCSWTVLKSLTPKSFDSKVPFRPPCSTAQAIHKECHFQSDWRTMLVLQPDTGGRHDLFTIIYNKLKLRPSVLSPSHIVWLYRILYNGHPMDLE